MITRIEIDGFKTFKDFRLDLAPFQVIIGPNGCGKSNLFDAIELLSRLATSRLEHLDLNERGSVRELFMVCPDGSTSGRISLAAEMLVNNVVTDGLGGEAHIATQHLRYEIILATERNENGHEQLYIEHERLAALHVKTEHGNKQTVFEEPYLLMEVTGGISHLHLYQDEPTGLDKFNSVPIHKIERTILSSVHSVDYAHILAAQQEMRSWKLLSLEPTDIRYDWDPEDDESAFILSCGGNIKHTLARMRNENEDSVEDVSHDLALLVPEVRSIELERDERYKFDKFTLWALMRDGRRLPSELLSDGILRLLVLAIIKNDPYRPLVLCFEEPENGVHPAILKRMLCLLKDSVDEREAMLSGQAMPYQILITTHSPELVSQLNIENGELLFAEMVSHVQSGGTPIRVTRITPVRSNGSTGSREGAYSLARVIEFLSNSDIELTRDILREALGH